MMRPYDFNYSGLLHRQRGGAGPASVPIGGLHLSAGAPVLPPQVYEDATVPPALSRTVAANAALFAEQGPVTGGEIPQHATKANAMGGVGQGGIQSSVFWNGAIYGVTANNGGSNVAKRNPPLTNYGAPLWGTANTRRHRLVAGPTRLLHCYLTNLQDTGFVTTCRSDTDRSAASIGGEFDGESAVWGYQIWRMLEVAPNVMLGLAFLHMNAATVGADLFRTTNDGVSWVRIAGPLSTPAVRLWCAVWKGTGNNIHMLGHAGAIATSTDQGATWSVNAAVPGAGNVFIYECASFDGNGIFEPCAALDLVNRKGLFLTSVGGLKSWNLDTPTTGFTNEAAAGFFTGAGTALFGSSKAFFVLGGTGPRPGLWYTMKGGNLGQWRQAATVARLAPLANGAQCVVPLGLEAGDGRVTVDVRGEAGATFPGAYQVADMATLFDRYWVADPGLPGGRKPYVRVT